MNKILGIVLLFFFTIYSFSQEAQNLNNWVTQEYETIIAQLPSKPQIDNQELNFNNYMINKRRFRSRGSNIQCILTISKLDILLTADFAEKYIKFYNEKFCEDFRGVKVFEGEFQNVSNSYRKNYKYSYNGQMIILNIFMGNNYLIEACSLFKISTENDKENDKFLKSIKLSEEVIFE